MRPPRLHLVTTGPERPDPTRSPRGGDRGDRGDLAVMAMLVGVNLVPRVGAAFTQGRWGSGTLGLATAGALVTGRELVRGARSTLFRRR